MKVVVFGPVDYYNNKLVEEALADCGFEITEILTTDDPGVAAAVRFIAEVKKIPCRVLAPDWDNLNTPKAEVRVKNGKKYNHRAGVDRNKSLVEIGDAFVLIVVGKPSEMLKNINRWIADLNKPVFILNIPA